LDKDRASLPDIRPGLYTIPASCIFLDELARGMISLCNGDVSRLALMQIFLPTRRAGRELAQSFVRLFPNRPLLMPRVHSVGDVDADELDLYLSGFGLEGLEVPPAISALERQFLLARLVQKKDPALNLDQALMLAGSLASLIDQVHTENLNFSGLKNLVPADFAGHWQETLAFLEIVTTNWPDILVARGMIDPADRRNRLMKNLLLLWQEHPPETPVIAAGSTGSIPTTAQLLKTIAGLPHGFVVLPHLDLGMGAEAWDSLTDTHPQATMKNLLRVMEKERHNVQPWPCTQDSFPARSNLVRAVMAPASHFAQKMPEDMAHALEGLEVIEAENPREEALAIALKLRSAAEDPACTACLVTPDRILARRVMTALKRWNIHVDDSAGYGLSATPFATFLSALLRAVEERFAPLPLLDFLKHALNCYHGHSALIAFERDVLRGPRPSSGFTGLHKRVQRLDPAFFTKTDELHALIDDFEKAFAPLLRLTEDLYSPSEFIAALIACAENFSPPETLWSLDESEAVAIFLRELRQHADELPPLHLRDFTGMLRTLLASTNYRALDAPYQRILILGQLESRLIRRDLMILAGMNEGTWPRDTGHDPWMSRSMRKNFGLPSAEKRVGLSAHDVMMHMGCATITLTRSMKAEGAATVPARWIQRLYTLMEATQISPAQVHGPVLSWARRIDAPHLPYSPVCAPAPCPPLAARPQKLSVTWVEKWMNNPYRVYAEKILKLRRLKPLDENTSASDRGTFVHEVLRSFVARFPQELPPDPVQEILAIGQEALVHIENRTPAWDYWWPRFVEVATHYAAQENTWRREAHPWIWEEEGAKTFFSTQDGAWSFTLTAKADRIDRMQGGGGVLIDYKTGTPPSDTALAKGLKPQLPLEALLLQEGAWRDSPLTPERLAFWKLGYGKDMGLLKFSKLERDNLIEGTRAGLMDLITLFALPTTPYTALAPRQPLYDDERDYAHLARLSEWASEDSAEDDSSTEDEEVS